MPSFRNCLKCCSSLFVKRNFVIKCFHREHLPGDCGCGFSSELLSVEPRLIDTAFLRSWLSAVVSLVCLIASSCLYCRVTTRLVNLEMSGNLTAVREMSGILLKVRKVSRKKSCGKSDLKPIYCQLHTCIYS